MKLVHKLTIIASLVLAFSFPALADTLSGCVVHVAAGDTLTVLDTGTHQHKIRLSGIDAPAGGFESLPLRRIYRLYQPSMAVPFQLGSTPARPSVAGRSAAQTHVKCVRECSASPPPPTSLHDLYSQ